MSDPVSLSARRRRGGFTLLELLVVVAVVAAVSGLMITKMDWVKRSADSATSLAGITQVQENLQAFRTVKNTYPDRLDSMLEAPATAGSQPTAKYAKMWVHAVPTFEVTQIAPPPPGPPAGPVFSLQHAGIARVLDHSTTTVFPGDSGSVLRTLDFSVPTAMLTVVANSRIEKAIYPDGKPADVTLIAFGIGPGCTANGITMASPPICTAIDPAIYYPRFAAIFAAYASGKRAELKTVVDSAGQVASTQLRNYYENTPQ